MNKPKIIIMNKALKIYYQEVKYQMRDFKRFKNFSSNKQKKSNWNKLNVKNKERLIMLAKNRNLMICYQVRPLKKRIMIQHCKIFLSSFI